MCKSGKELEKVVNKITCADCLDVLAMLPDKSVSLVVNDPPHFGVVNEEWDNCWSNMEEYLEWCEKWLRECQRVLTDSGSIYVWGSIGRKSDSVLHIKLLMDRLGLNFQDWITWSKTRGLGNRKGWMFTREELLWFSKTANYIWNADAQYSNVERKSKSFGFSTWKEGYRPKSDNYRLTNVWTDIPEATWDRNHPRVKHCTPKPIEALERIILAHTAPGDIVLDCFAGIGSTAVAAQNLGRQYIAVEIDEGFCNIAREYLALKKEECA